jgi:hypothetical protein
VAVRGGPGPAARPPTFWPTSERRAWPGGGRSARWKRIRPCIICGGHQWVPGHQKPSFCVRIRRMPHTRIPTHCRGLPTPHLVVIPGSSLAFGKSPATRGSRNGGQWGRWAPQGGQDRPPTRQFMHLGRCCERCCGCPCGCWRAGLADAGAGTEGVGTR